MRRPHLVALLALLAAAALSAGCGPAAVVRRLVPALSGMEREGPSLWVEPGMALALRAELQQDMVLARDRVGRCYGSVESSPRVFACFSPARARSLGLRARNRGVTLGGRTIVLGPHGLVTPILTHEWAHAESSARLGRGVMRRVPRWFDEGLASVVADEPWHSEAHWREIERRGMSVPHMNELYTYRQLLDALRDYGDTRSDSAGNQHVVYSAAAHEVRGWLARAGRDGLPRLITALRAGESFGPAYLRIGGPAPEEP